MVVNKTRVEQTCIDLSRLARLVLDWTHSFRCHICTLDVTLVNPCHNICTWNDTSCPPSDSHWTLDAWKLKVIPWTLCTECNPTESNASKLLGWGMFWLCNFVGHLGYIYIYRSIYTWCSGFPGSGSTHKIRSRSTYSQFPAVSLRSLDLVVV